MFPTSCAKNAVPPAAPAELLSIVSARLVRAICSSASFRSWMSVQVPNHF